MKISKLFHWLYAFLMALPIFAILSACLISTFNMSSKQETEVHYKYQTNEVNSNEDLVNDNLYLIDFNGFVNDYGYYSLLGLNGHLDLQYVHVNNGVDLYFASDYQEIDDFAMPLYSTGFYFTEYSVMNNAFTFGWFDCVFYCGVNNIEDFNILYGTSSQVPLVYRSSDALFSDFYKYVSVCPVELNFIDYVETHNVEIQDIFYDAIDKVKQSPLFSWAYNSNILGVPISYIGGIFGLASNSIVNVLLCYWVAISIIWLVFDLVMYVPLLVHRWLDKGVLE